MSLPSSMADFVPCDRLLQKAYSYQPIFKVPFINMWTNNCNHWFYTFYFYQLLADGVKGPHGALSLADFDPICQSPFVTVHPLSRSI